MGRPSKEAASPSALAPALLRYVASRGFDAACLASRCGHADLSSDADEVPITSSSLALMLDGAAELLAEPHLGLTLPGALVFRRYDGVALALRAAETPRDVFALVARYARLLFPSLDVEVVETDEDVRVCARIQGCPRGLGLRVDEYLLAFLLGHCRRGVTLNPRKAWLSTARPRDLGPLHTMLGTRDVDFGEETVGFSLAHADADMALPGGDPVLVATAEHLAAAALASAPRRGAFVDTVASRIEAALPGDVSADAMAEGLRISPRTLQRRLEEEGARFSEVLDGVREKVARRALRDSALPLAEVAYRAGFSDVATFSRAFKRWTGLAPGAFRRRDAR